MSLKTFLISLLEGEKMSEPLVDAQPVAVDPFTGQTVSPASSDASSVAATVTASAVEVSPLEKLKAKVSAIESAIALFGKEAEAELAALAEKYL